MHRARPRSRTALTALSVLTLVTASACGGDDDSGTATGVSSESEAVDGLDTTPIPSSAGTDTMGTAGGTDAGSSAAPSVADRPLPPGERHIDSDEGEPVAGGDLVFGLEADTSNPWAPYDLNCATSCYVFLTSVTDSLFTATADGQVANMLVESTEVNADATQWIFEIRDGISFHDGTPLDAAAVKFNLESCRDSPAAGSTHNMIDTIEASGQTLTIDLNTPYVVLPRLFTQQQCGYMFAPSWLGSLDSIPQRNPDARSYDADLAAEPAGGDPTQPVGLGPFVFESYTPGNGNGWVLTRNEDYWRGPNGITGENLPYLDSVRGVVAVDEETRSNGLTSGQFDIMHTANADRINQFLDDDDFETTATSLYGETSYAMLNLAQDDLDPDGVNADSPLLNVHCRRALAHALDSERLVEDREAGLSLPANGPFPPGSLGYLTDTGYPEYDPDAALAEMDTCLSELGTDTIEFSYNTTNDPFNVESNTLILSMWQEVFGDTVVATIAPIEQGQYIGTALSGDFNAFSWRNHGGIDPATQSYWWGTANAQPIGAVSVNFGRITDAEMDAQFEILWSDPDPAARRAAAERVNRIFGEQVYNLWTYWTLWAVVSEPYVNGVEANALPDGGDGVGLAFSGRHQMNQVWCDDGVCD